MIGVTCPEGRDLRGRASQGRRLIVKGIDGSLLIGLEIEAVKEAWQAPFTMLFG